MKRMAVRVEPEATRWTWGDVAQAFFGTLILFGFLVLFVLIAAFGGAA